MYYTAGLHFILVHRSVRRYLIGLPPRIEQHTRPVRRRAWAYLRPSACKYIHQPHSRHRLEDGHLAHLASRLTLTLVEAQAAIYQLP